MTDADEIKRKFDRLKEDLTFELQRRERPDRHPYQIGSLVGLLIVSLAQAILGTSPTSALHDVANHTTLLTLDLVLIVGSVLCLYGAILNRDKHFELSVKMGMYGHISIFFGCLAYTIIVIASTQPELHTKPYWLSVTSVGLTLGIAYASIARFKQMYGLLKEWRVRNYRRESNV